MYQEPSIDLFRGSLAHRIFARHLVDGPIPAGDFVLVCKKEAGAHLGATMASLSMKPSEFRAVVTEVEDLYDRFKSVPTRGFSGAEVDVESEPAEGVRLRGRVDAVFADADGIRIVDWKTGAYLADAEPQLDFYAMAWHIATGSLPVAMEALSLKTGEKFVSVPTEEQVAETEEGVAAMIGELRTAMHDRAELERSAGPHCRWCPLLEDCDEGTSALKILE